MFKHRSLPLDTKFCIKLTSKKLNIHNSKSENQCWPSIFTKLSLMLVSQKSWSTARVISSSRSRCAEWKKNQTCCFFFFLSVGLDYSLLWNVEQNKIGRRSPTKKKFRGDLHAHVSWRDFDAWPEKRYMVRECGNGQRYFTKQRYCGQLKLGETLQSEINFL